MSHRPTASSIALLVGLLATARVALAEPAATGRCACDRFAEELATTQRVFASRGDGAEVPLTPAMHARYRERIDETYARALCLTQCTTVPDRDRNPARVLLSQAAFRSNTAQVPEPTLTERLENALTESARCLATAPGNAECHLLHASARGLLLRRSWNPMNLRAPRQLIAEFQAARAGKPPGEDLYDGGATRGEALLRLRAPGFAGGDIQEARRIVEQAMKAPRFGCQLSNRLLVGEMRTAIGDHEGARRELDAIIADGMPACGLQRYENAISLEEAMRCRDKLEKAPGTDPGWADDCA